MSGKMAYIYREREKERDREREIERDRGIDTERDRGRERESLRLIWSYHTCTLFKA